MMSRRAVVAYAVAGMLLLPAVGALPAIARPPGGAASNGARLALSKAVGRDSWAPSGTTRVNPRLVGSRVSRDGSERSTPTPGGGGPAVPAPPVSVSPLREQFGKPFAGVANLRLVLPEHVKIIGFHESGTWGTLPMHPEGAPRHNDNMTRLAAAPVSHGPDYVIMRSRGRGPGPTTAVDLAMPFNHPVRSPVSGTVVKADSYLLYGRVPDNILIIQPDSRPDLRLVIFHVNGVRVTKGQRVEAGKTVLALTARQLPFGSQIDSYSGPLPHIHLELRPA